MNAAMKSRREATLKSVLSALWNLSAHCSTNKADICAVPGALAFLVDMLGYRPPSTTLTIIENAGGILRNVSSHIAIRDDYRCILRDKGCLPLLLQQLKSPSLTVVSNACGTLWNLSAKCEQDQRALWDMGAAPMLRSLNHSKHAMIATGSRAALKNLLSSRPAHNLFNHVDATAREMGLPTLPTLGARKQRALAKDLDQNLAETCDNIEPTSPPQLLSPITCELSMVATNTTITTNRKKMAPDTQQLVESFASLNLTKNEHDEHYNNSKPKKTIENLKKTTTSNTSNTTTTTNNENYSDYAETDLDQPTNYSLRYAENDSDSDIIPDEEQFDTVKTYCTEGTPLNFSTATSMSDLRQIDAAIPDKDNKKPKSISKENVILKVRGDCESSGLMTPEKPVKYCEEGTPGSFSRRSSFSSLNIDDKQNAETNDDDDDGAQVEDKTAIATIDIEKVEKTTVVEVVVVTTTSTSTATATAAAAVAAATGAEETPLMFSRCSSLCSLSSAEQHSIHDDRSSIISDFSRLTSGIVSPSELPDSPTQTVPPSPRQRRAPIDFVNKLQSQSQSQPQQPQHRQQNKSVFDDNIIKFKQANTPIEFSANTSLSSLTIDDEPPSNINFNILTGIVLGDATTTTATSTPLKLEATSSADHQNNDVDEQEEDDMLAACINIGIQNNRHREKKQLKQKQHTNIPVMKSAKTLLPEVDSTRVYCTEDTPAMLSHAGSQSDLSLLSVETSSANRNCNRKREENINVLDLSDDSGSNLSGDNESNILAECIQSGMPKAKATQQNQPSQPRITALAMAARDEIATYAVEDSPCQFSLRSSLSDLTIDSKKVVVKQQSRSRAESLSSLSVESFGSTENAEQVLLEQCISSGMPSKNGQSASVPRKNHKNNKNRVTGDIKNEKITNFKMWPQLQAKDKAEDKEKQEDNIINTEMIVKNNLDTVDKCSELLDGSIEDNCDVRNRMLDPDAMIESLDRFTAELVSQSSHLQQSYGNNGNDTWNEDTSPNDISFPSISVSAPLVASFNSDKSEREVMTESTLIAIEAANIVNTVQQEQVMQESLDLEHIHPPSMMDSLVSLTSSITRKRSLPIGNLMIRRALTNNYENMTQDTGPNSISSSSCSNLDYCKPPSIMGDFLDLVDMENSMVSVASITSEDIYTTANPTNTDLCDSTADLITDNIFQDCLTHQQVDDVTLTEYSDANSVTPIQSDIASSSAESTPKKERSICMRMTPKQRRQHAKDRYKTYTLAAEMCIIEQQNKLTPKERRLLDRERFQTRVLDVDSIQKQIEQQLNNRPTTTTTLKQRRIENKERFQTQTLNGSNEEEQEEDLHVVLAQQANIVLDTLHADELLDCETLSLVSNDDESELNSVSSVNYRTYHKSWGFTKTNLPNADQEQVKQIPKIIKPTTTTTNTNIVTTKIEPETKTIRGRRKPLYSSSSVNKSTTSPLKKPFRTMTSNLVKNVTTTIKTTTTTATTTKPPIAKFNVVRSNTTIKANQQQTKVEKKKPELLKNRSSSNGSIPLNSKPLERQGTFTKDNTKKSKIPESKIPTNKFRSSMIQNRTISSTSTSTSSPIGSKINRSPSTDRSSSSDFGFRNRSSRSPQIHQSNSTQSLQNGATTSTTDTIKRSSNPDITDATPKRKPVASRIASLWKKSHSDVGEKTKKTNTNTTASSSSSSSSAVKMRKKTTTLANSDGTKRLSRLGSFIKVDEISVT